MKKIIGFTITEVMLVIMILVVLTVIAVPMMRTSQKRAILRQAIGGMEAIRVTQRTYYNAHNEYESLGAFFIVGTDGYPFGIDPGQLNGTYFSEECYRINVNRMSSPPTRLTIDVYMGSDDNNAPKADITRALLREEVGSQIMMDERGHVRTYDITGSGYEDWTDPY